MRYSSLTAYLKNLSRHSGDVAYLQRRGYRVVRWSYRELLEAASQFARELQFQNIQQGDRVLIWGENSGEWVSAFWGCVLRGAVVVPMDRIASPDFALQVARQVQARLVVCSRELAGKCAEFPTLALEEVRERVAAHSAAAYPSPELKREDTVEIVFTSGTTAEPKGVVISHGNVLANLEPLEAEIRKYLKYERWVHPLRFLNLLPLSHVFGQFLGIFVPPLLGATVVSQESINPAEVTRAIKRERISVLVAVPRLLESLEQKLEREFQAAGRMEKFRAQLAAAENEAFLRRWWRFRRIHALFGWKFWALISGGAALDPQIEEFWRRLGFAVVQGYGLTETTSLISVNHPFQMGRGSIGKVLPGRELQLDEIGEILVRGENISPGYWQGRELQPVRGEEGWFHTGDLGELDEHGNLYFKGRKKNVIVTAEGMNVHPEDLEAALRRQPEVADCVVVGVVRGGNAEPCAVLILRDGGAGAEAIVGRANQSLADYQRIRCWLVWPGEDFPRTATQKPRVSEIQALVQKQQAEPTQAGNGGATQQGSIAELIGQITGRAGGSFSSRANLEGDLNLSSIERVELMSAIEDRYQLNLDEERFTKAATVGEVERMISASRSSAPAPPIAAAGYSYPRWPQRWPFTWLRLATYYLLAWPATMLLGKPRVSGREQLRDLQGPVLVICNHVAFLDPGYVLAALPARLRHRLAVAMEGERLLGMRHPPANMNFFARLINKLAYFLVLLIFNVFPLPQKSGFRESFAFAGESVDRGYSVLVFPEGHRTKDGKMIPFRAGIGLLAKNLALPVVPMRIDGLFELKQKGKRVAPPGAVRVRIGAPLRLEPESDPEDITRELQRRVESL